MTIPLPLAVPPPPPEPPVPVVPPLATETAADAVTFPEEFTAVKTYVVVALGETATDPVSPETVPTPGEMLRAVAPLVAQESVDDWPEVTLVGFAVNEEIAGGALGGVADCTVTLIEAVLLPDEFVAVNTYVVVVAGLTLTLPLPVATDPTPGEMLTDDAPPTAHESVEVCPAEMLAGLAVNDEIVGAGEAVPVPVDCTVTVTVEVTDPPGLLAVSVYVVVAAGDTDALPFNAKEWPVGGCIVTAPAPLVVQESVVVPPGDIVLGTA